MAKPQSSPGAAALFENFAPKLCELTQDTLFGDIWNRPGLSPRDRSLVTITTLMALGQTEQLTGHVMRGLDNGLKAEELIELMTHLAFYIGWPRTLSAFSTLKPILKEQL